MRHTDEMIQLIHIQTGATEWTVDQTSAAHVIGCSKASVSMSILHRRPIHGWMCRYIKIEDITADTQK